MAGGHVPHAIVLALGAGVLGGPDALRLLLQFAGRTGAAVDLAICVVVISLLTVPVLGTMLLARFVRKPARSSRGGGVRAPATDLFAQVTAAVSVGAALLVTACLLVVPGPGGQIGAAGVPIDFAAVNPIAVTVLVACAAAAAAANGSLARAAHLRARLFRGAGAGSVGGAAAPAAAAAPATTASRIKAAAFVVTTSLVAQLLLPELHWRRRTVTAPVVVGVAVVTVAGATLLVVWRYSRRARSAAGAGGGGAAAARTS